MLGIGGASFMLEAMLRLLAVLSRLVARLRRMERRMDMRTVFSMSSFWCSGK